MVPGAVKPTTTRRRAIRLGFAAVCLAVVAVGLAVVWRRDTPADRWMAEMRAKGEKFTLAELGLERPGRPHPTAEALEVASGRFNALHEAAIPVRSDALEDPQPGRRYVRWKEPYLYSDTSEVLDWQRAGAVADRLQAARAELHAALRQPPRDPGWSYTNVLHRTPNFVHYRTVARGLQGLILVELHRHNLPAAHQDLLTLIRLCRLNEEGWTLVTQMVRTALLGLTTGTVWEALQTDGWTEDQLNQIQEELERTVIIPQLPRAWEVERVGVLDELDRYRREGPASLAWQWQLPGFKRPPAWLERPAFILWRVARCDQDRLSRLQQCQQRIERYRRLASGVALLDLLPIPVETGGWWSRSQPAQNLFPFSTPLMVDRVAETVTRNDTDRLLAVTAVALERHRLRHGGYPRDLEALRPDFLDVVPREAISGQALQYRLEAKRGPLLYAVGFDALPNRSVYWSAPGRAATSVPRDTRLLIWPRPVGEDEPPAEVLPLVQFEAAPVREVIVTLARQAGMNIVFDPALSNTLKRPLTMRLENVTACDVLDAVLRNEGLRLQENPVTTLCRITAR